MWRLQNLSGVVVPGSLRRRGYFEECFRQHRWDDGHQDRIPSKSRMKNKQVWINGRPIVIHGTDIHEHNPLTGHALTNETRIKDITLMKKFNINAIRMSHYPQSPGYVQALWQIWHLRHWWSQYRMPRIGWVRPCTSSIFHQRLAGTIDGPLRREWWKETKPSVCNRLVNQ